MLFAVTPSLSLEDFDGEIGVLYKFLKKVELLARVGSSCRIKIS